MRGSRPFHVDRPTLPHPVVMPVPTGPHGCEGSRAPWLRSRVWVGLGGVPAQPPARLDFNELRRPSGHRAHEPGVRARVPPPRQAKPRGRSGAECRTGKKEDREGLMP